MQFIHRLQIFLFAWIVYFSSPAFAGVEKNWAFNRGDKPPIPPAIFPKLAANPIDHFVQARLDGMHPSPEAGRGTLIRRIYFNLWGLPPSPEQVSAFVNDREPGAWERLIDQLLESPRYGERWARHWLDVVHYGETHGYDKDKPRANAWPYRDYVIGAFNQDKTYSRFIQEQIAADALFPEEGELTAALGFLAAGPWDFVGHVELPESKMDGLVARYNDRDDMIMNTFSSFMSLTVHCARCHDHKFDPISTRDYYKLQAVFAGTDRADREYDADRSITTRRRELREKEASAKSKLDGLKQKRTSASNGFHSGISAVAETTKWVQVDLGEVTEIESIVLVAARPTDFVDTPGFGFPLRYKIEVSDDSDFTSPRMLLDRTPADVENPQTRLVFSNLDTRGRFVRVTATKLWQRTNDYVFALAELQVFADGENIALKKAVAALDSIEAGRWSTRFLVDDYSSREPLGEAEDSAEISKLEDELGEIEAGLKALPKPHVVYAANHQFLANGHFKPAAQPRPVHLLRRGEVSSPGELMEPGALEAFPRLRFNAARNVDDPARRAALALWISDPENFLARRSFVNRIWQYHFGRGLVDSPNDFGRMGSSPSHPELLDWLGHWFVENGESTKKLHKLILTSHTWRQQSAHHEAFARIDGENRRLWRMNRRRLEAEAVRDTMLHAAGKLDLRQGGPSDQQFMFKDDHSPIYDYSGFDVDSPAANRRAIYRFIVRTAPDPFMDALDCPDSSQAVPVRNTTITALQALATLNNAFVVRRAENIAKRVAGESDELENQIRALVWLALSREVSEAELKSFSSYARRHGLPALCRVVLNLNEFLFID